MLNFLAFNSNKFALYFTPITLFVFLVLIVLILVIYTRKNRKISQNGSKNIKKNANFNSESVKTVYSNKEDNFSKTENLPVPENFSTQEFDFEFAGWDKYFVDENGQFVTQAIWTRKPKEYVVRIFGRDENTPIAIKTVNFGASVDLMELMPEKEIDENYEYTFIGWDQVPTSVECDTDIHARFEIKDKNGEVISAPSYGSDSEVNVEELIRNEVLNETEESQFVEENFDNESKLASDFVNSVESQDVDSLLSKETFESQMSAGANDYGYQKMSFDDDEYGYGNEEIVESFDDYDSKFDDKYEKNDDSQLFNNIKVGKPAITHGVDTTVRSKNGFKIETSNSIYNAYSINVDNKSASADSDDIFKRAGVGIRGVTPSNSSLSDSFDASVSKPSGVSYQVNRTTQNVKPEPEPVDENSETEQFFRNTMLVNHRKTIKK